MEQLRDYSVAGSWYVAGMRHLLRSRSRYFRAVLVLAALAWIMPASGALAGGTARMLDATASAQSVQLQAVAPRCDGSAMTCTASQLGHAPALPMGSGGCCHGGCHCVSACNAVLSVPRLVVAEPWLHAAFPIAAPADPVPALSAPPLRPPIA